MGSSLSGASRPTWETTAAHADQCWHSTQLLAKHAWVRTNELCVNSCCASIWPQAWSQAADEADIVYLPITTRYPDGSPAYAYPRGPAPPQPYFSRPADRALYAIGSGGSEEEEEEEELDLRDPPHAHRHHHHHSSVAPHPHLLPSPSAVPHYSYRPHFADHVASEMPPSHDTSQQVVDDRDTAAAAHMSCFEVGTPLSASPPATQQQGVEVGRTPGEGEEEGVEGEGEREGEQRSHPTTGASSAATSPTPGVDDEEEDFDVSLDEMDDEDDGVMVEATTTKEQEHPLQQQPQGRSTSSRQKSTAGRRARK